ncbi:Anti-sigma regulatory factor (Ser/Thr protein kinase) [Streptomyces sp. 2224.1]|nr:Anti-sigma regulatory factor (Ser/Thr protein kinase) [Streptomyces sp. 2224.1]
MRSKGIPMSTRARPAATRLAPVPAAAVAHLLPSDDRSAARARAALRRQLRVWRIGGELADSAELLLSELVTNAVRAQAPGVAEVGIRFAWADGRLRLEVRDASDELPVRGEAKEDEECGRGLVLVDALASGWGVDRDGTGKTVWAELAGLAGLAACDAPAAR